MRGSWSSTHLNVGSGEPSERADADAAVADLVRAISVSGSALVLTRRWGDQDAGLRSSVGEHCDVHIHLERPDIRRWDDRPGEADLHVSCRGGEPAQRW
jgi:hypothetical protein